MSSEQSTARRLIPSITSGVVIGVLEVALAISFAALIFAGSLAPFVPYGIGYALVGAIIGGAIVALFTSWPGFVGGNQDVPAAIIALMSAAIAGLMPASSTAEETFITVVVTIAITTLVTGLFFLGTGYFHLGSLARFLPYPVVGGFLAATGWLLISGAVSLMADLPPALLQLPALLQSDVILRWLPGVLLAVVIMVVLNRLDHYLVLPVMLLLSTGLFFLIAWGSGSSLADLSAGGWLLGPFAGDGLWQPIRLADLAQVYWPAVFSQAAGIAAIVMVSTISLLLNAGGVELAVDSDIDLDKELRVAGAANMLSSLASGLVGYQQLSFSVLNDRIGANNRLTGMVSTAVCVLALLAGASVLALFPKVVVGALLFLLGLSFIVEWVVEGWSRMPHVDYAIVITILLVTVLVGFFEAVAFGLLLAVILFVVGYSQIDVVRHESSGATYHSRVVRSRPEERLLLEHGEEIIILQLQGFIFFGTADSLLKKVRQRMGDDQLPPLTAVVLDFAYVNGLDSTALISLNRMKTTAAARGVTIVICRANKRSREQLERGGLSGEDTAVRYFDSVDHGVAWCEARLLDREDIKPHLAAEQARQREGGPTTEAILARQIAEILHGGQERHTAAAGEQEAAVEAMLSHFEKLNVDAGMLFISQGTPADSLYFLAEGTATVRLAVPDGSSIRLETVGGGGRILGEIGFFLGGERTADVVAEENSILFRLTRDQLAHMEKAAPQAALLLRRLVANILAERVVRLTNTVRTLDR